MDKHPALSTPEQGSEALIDLREVLRILNQYRWGLVGITLMAILASVLYAYSLTPVYRATATLLIEAKSNQPIEEVKEVYDPGIGRNEYYSTQAQILKSREFARRVVERMHLVGHEEFLPKPPTLLAKVKRTVFDWRRWLPFLPEAEEGPLSDAEKATLRVERVIDEFSSRLTVQLVPYTQLVKVSFDAEDPELAANAANELSDVFIESALEGRLQVAQKASGWLSERLEDIKADLQKSEQDLQAFREREQLIDVGGERSIIELELTDNAERLREAQRTRANLSSAYAKIQAAKNDPAMLEDVKPLFDDPLVDKAKEDVIRAQVKMEQLEKRYGPKHPEMINAQAQLDGATAVFQRQLTTAARGIQAKYEVARENERMLGQFESRARDSIRALDRKQYQLRALEREVATNRQLYDMFLTRFKETDIAGGYESLFARVIDSAIAPREPFSPNKRRIVILAAIGGLLIGLVLAALAATLSDMVRSGEELESVTGSPVLGVLPLLPASERRQLPHHMVREPRSAFAEGVRSIRTGVLLSDLDKKKKRIVVSSSIPEEGKTTLAINLAIAHGQIEKVLLLEGDLRRPSIAEKCGIKDKSVGLVDWLSGSVPLESCIYRDQASNIDILPAGKAPPNPAEIFASGRFHKLTELLAERYDRIIVDSAPCHAVSDTVLLSQNCDGLIFLVQADAAGKRAIRSAVRHLRQAKVPMIGAVVNQVDLKRHGHYYASYYYDYGYYA